MPARARFKGHPRAPLMWGRPKFATAGAVESRSGPPALRHGGPTAESANVGGVLENTRNQEVQRLQPRSAQGKKTTPRPPHPASSCCPTPRIIVVSTCGCGGPHSPSKSNIRCAGCGKESAQCDGSSCLLPSLSNPQGTPEKDVARHSGEAPVEESPSKTSSFRKRRNRKKAVPRRKESPRAPRGLSRFPKNPPQTSTPFPLEAVDDKGDSGLMIDQSLNAMEQNVRDMSIGGANDVFSNNTVLNLTPDARRGHIHQPGVQIFFNGGY